MRRARAKAEPSPPRTIRSRPKTGNGAFQRLTAKRADSRRPPVRAGNRGTPSVSRSGRPAPALRDARRKRVRRGAARTPRGKTPFPCQKKRQYADTEERKRRRSERKATRSPSAADREGHKQDFFVEEVRPQGDIVHCHPLRCQARGPPTAPFPVQTPPCASRPFRCRPPKTKPSLGVILYYTGFSGKKRDCKKSVRNDDFLLTVGGLFTKHFFARWAIVQLAGRRILVPLIVVQVHVAQPDFLRKVSAFLFHVFSHHTKNAGETGRAPFSGVL